MYCKKSFTIMALLCALASVVYPQDSSSFRALSGSETKEIWFDHLIGLENAGIVNGSEYHAQLMGSQSHPFFDVQPGAAIILYDGHIFRNASILYDIYGDHLVLHYQNTNRVSFVLLDKEKVQHFDAYGHHFKKINGGFYDVLFEKKDFLLAVKRSKITKVKSGKVEYERADHFYFVTDGQWMRLTNKKSFHSVLKGKAEKKQFDDFLKTHEIRIRNIGDEDFQKIASFCYELKQKREQPG